MSFRKSAPLPAIRFTCAPADFGVIAPPVPARGYLPDWFRRLPAVDETVVSRSNTGLTVRRCMPFLDATTTGWILPLPATLRMQVSHNDNQVDRAWDFDRTLVSSHGKHQVRGNPRGPPSMVQVSHLLDHRHPAWVAQAVREPVEPTQRYSKSWSGCARRNLSVT